VSSPGYVATLVPDARPWVTNSRVDFTPANEYIVDESDDGCQGYHIKSVSITRSSFPQAENVCCVSSDLEVSLDNLCLRLYIDTAVSRGIAKTEISRAPFSGCGVVILFLRVETSLRESVRTLEETFLVREHVIPISRDGWLDSCPNHIQHSN
jgi:hypothetical protein